MSSMTSQATVPLRTPKCLEEARALLREYAAEIQSSPCLGTIAKEIEQLPGDYSPPGGMFFLGLLKGETAGCVAFRRIADDLCEMKRLYVRPAGRGNGLGRQLAEAVIDAARTSGYSTLRLDTLPSMIAAQSLYRSLGFEISRSRDGDCDQSVIYFELRLS